MSGRCWAELVRGGAECREDDEPRLLSSAPIRFGYARCALLHKEERIAYFEGPAVDSLQLCRA
jgi:hypothetical protein